MGGKRFGTWDAAWRSSAAFLYDACDCIHDEKDGLPQQSQDACKAERSDASLGAQVKAHHEKQLHVSPAKRQASRTPFKSDGA